MVVAGITNAWRRLTARVVVFFVVSPFAVDSWVDEKNRFVHYSSLLDATLPYPSEQLYNHLSCIYCNYM